MRLAGRRVLITGASRGIGEELAIAFAGAGARVALVARSEVALKELAARLGGTAHATDLSDPTQVEGLIARIEADGGPVDVLVNNAGFDHTGWFPDMSDRELRDLYTLNLVTPAELCRQVVRRMLDRGAGHIVNVSSLAGVGVFPGIVGYASTKAGLSQLTAGLRADLRGLPIGTTLVELGPVPTSMLERADEYAPTAKSFARFRRIKLLADVSASTVAAAVVDAVEHDRRHVRFPRRALAFPLMAEAPRRIVEVLLTGVKPRA